MKDENGEISLEKDEIIFGAYFFLSDDLGIQYRIVYNIIDLLAEFGGLNGVLFVIYKFFGEQFTKNIIVAKFIRSLYLVKDDNSST